MRYMYTFSESSPVIVSKVEESIDNARDNSTKVEESIDNTLGNSIVFIISYFYRNDYDLKSYGMEYSEAYPGLKEHCQY